ncbi:MAG TPA: FAD-dependent oxidoreductase, partial [Blastocatellia bacterium]|nr:FAD-dependent oxidoreductase [Blastocatellia bacterium]
MIEMTADDQLIEADEKVMQDELILGINGFTYPDLYTPRKLEELTNLFYEEVATADPELAKEFADYASARGVGYADKTESNLIVKMAPHLSKFIARLFNIAAERDELRDATLGQMEIFDFKKNFVQRRVFKKRPEDALANIDFDKLDRAVSHLQQTVFTDTIGLDDELATARIVVRLMNLAKEYSLHLGQRHEPLTDAARQSVQNLIAAITGHADFVLPAVDENLSAEANEQNVIAYLLEIFELWAFAQYNLKYERVKNWVSYREPHALDYSHLVQIQRPRPDLPELIAGPDSRLRLRDGFKLTDRRYNDREVLNEVDYCLYCHERDKDSCSKGFIEKDGTFRRNPLGIPLNGCPLDEKISEMHSLKRDGDSIAAIATAIIDNPMVPGTGHRICNDCMKGCIFQKQDPVNIPQAETGILTDVLNLPYGFEIYSLLTRWNPLNVKRPHALPYNGKNVLVVGLGPAGYTLAHYLLNEGFGVIGIDGLKIEPLSPELAGDENNPPKPIRDIREIETDLDKRVLSGFGGVSEYGITVRWDKNFLTMIHLTLRRRDKFRAFGGVRFGGTMTIEDAWKLGFDHIAIATGAGKPTVIDMKNNLIRGIRKASDFLMALQLTGAFKQSAMANLQVQLPAVVIGGGLTGIDTATEMMAYYPVQVEKMLERYEILAKEYCEDHIWKMYDEEERKIMQTFIEHGRAVRAEREHARMEDREPNFVDLVRKWGGVSLVYRKSMNDAPAYRLNHEEIIKALEEGIYFVEQMNPVEAEHDEFGAVAAIKFERMKQDENGKWRASGEFVTMPAKTVCVAA